MVLEPRFLIPDSIYSPLYHLASFAFIQEQKKKNFFFSLQLYPQLKYSTSPFGGPAKNLREGVKKQGGGWSLLGS